MHNKNAAAPGVNRTGGAIRRPTNAGSFGSPSRQPKAADASAADASEADASEADASAADASAADASDADASDADASAAHDGVRYAFMLSCFHVFIFIRFYSRCFPAHSRLYCSTPASAVALSPAVSPTRTSARTAAHQATVLAAQVQAAAGEAAVQEAMAAFSSIRLATRAAHEKQKVAQAALSVAAVRVQQAFRAKQAAHRDAQKAAEEAAQEAARMEKQEADLKVAQAALRVAAVRVQQAFRAKQAAHRDAQEAAQEAAQEDARMEAQEAVLRAERKEISDARAHNDRLMKNLEAQCVFVWMYRVVLDTCILPGACIPHAVRLSDECILLYRKTVRFFNAVKFSKNTPQISIVDFPYPLNPSRREVQAVHRVRASIIELYDLEGQALVAIWESIKHLELHNGQADEQWRAIIDALNSHRDGVGQELSSQAVQSTWSPEGSC